MDILPQDTTPRKQCSNSNCLQWFPATSEFFYERKGSKDGLNRQCKECVKARVNNHTHKPEVYEAKRAYARLPETRARQYARMKQGEDLVKKRAYARQYYRRPDVHKKRLEFTRLPEVQAKHREAEHKRSQQPHVKAQAAQRDKAYRQTPQGKQVRRIGYLKHMARKKAIPGDYTRLQILDKLKAQKYKCYYCLAQLEKQNEKYIYHIDHTFPLSRVAGTDIPANDINYLVLTCPHCNMSKGDKFPWEWHEGGRLL
jgi:hypothetical protein